MSKISVKFIFFCVFVLLTKRSPATIVEDFFSPVTTEAAPLFLSSTAMSTFMYIKQKDISGPATYQASKDRPLKQWSIYGDLYGQLYPNIIYTAIFGGHALLANNNKSWYRASHMAKATIYASILVTALKYTIRQPRPDNPEERNSFPSGHTTTAFAFGATVAMQHNVYVGTAAVLMAAFTAYSRMNDGRHYLHDVVGGMTIGIGYGVGIYHAQRGRARFAIVPIVDENASGLRIVKSF